MNHILQGDDGGVDGQVGLGARHGQGGFRSHRSFYDETVPNAAMQPPVFDHGWGFAVHTPPALAAKLEWQGRPRLPEAALRQLRGLRLRLPWAIQAEPHRDPKLRASRMQRTRGRVARSAATPE